MKPFVIGLGANLGQPEEQLRSALQRLARHSQVELGAVSEFVRSPPLGGMDQPDYCNAVAMGRTHLEAPAFLALLQAIETEQGRQRDGVPRWAARVLDLDLLTFADEQRATAELTLPHPGIRQRSFVLLPWLSIDPKACLPCGQRLADLAKDMPALPRWEASITPPV